MSLAVNVTNLAVRVATESKALRTMINGNTADLTALTTVSKTSLLSAINEINAAMAGAGVVIDDVTASTTKVYSSTKTNTAISAAVAAVVASSPATLDTLNELATALANDPNFATTMTNSLALKAPLVSPSLTTPTLGVASATTINKVAITAPATSATLTIAQGATLTASATATVSGTNTGDQSLAAFAPLASPAFSGTPTGITKTHVGLANVDNTSDVNKPLSTADTNALALKAPLASPTLTGTPVLGAASATSINKVAITAPATGSTLTIVEGATLTASATASVSGTNTGDQNLAAYATTATVGDTTTDFVATFNAGLV